ncbi:CHAT domain-containing protein [Cristinia sonorae]|uniref:CHAT domain-containing protein n=1 Tax=Cristinia sonorae TaxID=1940300 RepID=A0A8K0UY47_9AGAR|nr:CHAT domain-containing protein [Cristinia sonorae]
MEDIYTSLTVFGLDDTSSEAGAKRVVLCDFAIETSNIHLKLDGILLRIAGLEDEEEVVLDKESNDSWSWSGVITIKPEIDHLLFTAQSTRGDDLGRLCLDCDDLERYLEADDDFEDERQFIGPLGMTMSFTISVFTIAPDEPPPLTFEEITKMVNDVSKNPALFPKVLTCLVDAGAQYLHTFGFYLSHEFEDTGTEADITHSIEAFEYALKLTSPEDQAYLVYTHSAGAAYLSRFTLIGDSTDLDKALSLLTFCASQTTSRDFVHAERLNRLGIAYRVRFTTTSDLVDLEEAILNQEQGVLLTPPGHPDLASRLASLGNSFKTRFERKGDLVDIDSAIANTSRAVEISTGQSYSPNLPLWLGNLGSFHQMRFGRTGKLEDADIGLEYQEKGIRMAPKNHPRMGLWMNNLGCSFRMRSQRSKAMDDVEKGLTSLQQAVELTLDRNPAKPSYLFNLGVSYRDKFTYSKDPNDIEFAVTSFHRAIELSPEGHAAVPRYLRWLAMTMQARFEITGKQEDILSAIASFRSAATHLTGHPSVRLTAARQWAVLCRDHDRPQSLEAFRVAIELLSQVAGLEQTIRKRHVNLVDVADLTTLAAATAVDEGELSTAVEWLEQGRCLVWNQINQLRASVDGLRGQNPELAEKFSILAQNLEELGARAETSALYSSTDESMEHLLEVQDKVHNHVRLSKEYKELLVRIRSIPGFHDFLRPPTASDIFSKLPHTGCIVIFVVHQYRCDALALKAGHDEPIHIPLKTLSFNRAVQIRDNLHLLLKTQGVRMRNADDDSSSRAMRPSRRRGGSTNTLSALLEEIWIKVVQPVLLGLGLSTPPVDPSSRQRIWWCPTGPFAFLPLHAAGVYKRNSALDCTTSDFVVSSYTPTITALLSKLDEVSRSNTELQPGLTSFLLVSQPHTPGLSRIPQARKESKAIIERMSSFPEHFSTLLLEDDAATVERVKDEMKTHSWVHFACHAAQDPTDSLKSGTHLHDGRLELLEIMRQRSLGTELAFLSACQTGTGDEKLSDEVVHIAAGMLAVGYKCVVATMWSIQDAYGPVIASGFYDHLLDSTGHSHKVSMHRVDRAAWALDSAVRAVQRRIILNTKDQEEALLVWVPYVHYGI